MMNYDDSDERFNTYQYEQHYCFVYTEYLQNTVHRNTLISNTFNINVHNMYIIFSYKYYKNNMIPEVFTSIKYPL